MKILFDFLPIILFFATFKYAEGHKEWAAAFASSQLGFLVSGGVVGPEEAPVLLATVVVIVASLAQVAWLKSRGKKVDTMLWVSLVLVVRARRRDHLLPQRDLHQVETERAVLGDGAGVLAQPAAVRQEHPAHADG